MGHENKRDEANTHLEIAHPALGASLYAE